MATCSKCLATIYECTEHVCPSLYPRADDCLPGFTATLDKVPASAVQHGGAHYLKQKIQPWDYIAANGLDFFQGSVVKYVTRFRDKNGIDDLRKARHFIDKLIELETDKALASKVTISKI